MRKEELQLVLNCLISFIATCDLRAAESELLETRIMIYCLLPQNALLNTKSDADSRG